MRNERAVLVAIACLMSPGVCPMGASAQDYPNQPIKLIIPNPPGGPGDIISRAFTEKARTDRREAIRLRISGGRKHDNRHGSCRKIRAGRLYDPWPCLLQGSERPPSRSSSDTTLKLISPPSRALEQCRWCSLSEQGSNIKTMTDFTAAVRTGKLTFGTAGVGTIGHLTALLLMNEVEGKATHVPFKGNPEVTQALLGGHVDFSILSVADAAPYAGSKDVVLIATTADRRLSDLPNTPTMTEVGLPHVGCEALVCLLGAEKNASRSHHASIQCLCGSGKRSRFREAASKPWLQCGDA